MRTVIVRIFIFIKANLLSNLVRYVCRTKVVFDRDI